MYVATFAKYFVSSSMRERTVTEKSLDFYRQVCECINNYVYTIHRQHGAQATMCTQYANKNEVAIEFLRRQEHEHSTSITFVALILLDYKRARQSRRVVVKIQSALCEVA